MTGLKLIQRRIWADAVCSDIVGVTACMTQPMHISLQANLQGRGTSDYVN